MLQDEILELELSLLLIKYGERKVVNSLARVVGRDVKDIQTKLQKLRQTQKMPESKRAAAGAEAINELIDQYPEKAGLLRTLYSRFQDKTFLPELRDIKRLLNRHSLESQGLKSRNSSVLKVFKLLASLNDVELAELIEQRYRGDYSSLGIISDEILRRKD